MRPNRRPTNARPRKSCTAEKAVQFFLCKTSWQTAEDVVSRARPRYNKGAQVSNFDTSSHNRHILIKRLPIWQALFSLVLLRRIELRTPWLKVMCSTFWANGSYSFSCLNIIPQKSHLSIHLCAKSGTFFILCRFLKYYPYFFLIFIDKSEKR